tara:strand:+ start:1350 stop:1580 length:231 start_codon:yes stop_codon:yes gene_type:complete
MGLGMSLTIVFYYLFKFVKFVKEDNARKRYALEEAERQRLEEISKVIDSIIEYQETSQKHNHPNVINFSDYQRRDD